LRFSGEVLADIYVGKVKKWDAEELQELNPGVKLPNLKITVVYRSDSSGTSNLWSDYLSRVSSAWKQGATNQITVPGGVGREGNAGVSAFLKQTPGALGYIEFRYALENNLPYGAVKNRDRFFVRADLDNILATAEKGLEKLPDDLTFSLLATPGKESYPICGAVWAVVYKTQPTQAKRDALAAFLRWAVTDGQQFAPDIHYARLPQSFSQRIQEQVNQLTVRLPEPKPKPDPKAEPKPEPIPPLMPRASDSPSYPVYPSYSPPVYYYTPRWNGCGRSGLF